MTAAREHIEAPWGESVRFLTEDEECLGVLRDADIKVTAQAAPRDCGSVGVWLEWRSIKLAVSQMNAFKIAGEIYMGIAAVKQGAESRGESVDSLVQSIREFYSSISTLDVSEREIINATVDPAAGPAAQRKKRRNKKRRQRKQRQAHKSL